MQSVDGGVVDIPNLGPVRQMVYPDRLEIVNTTLPGHRLHPGNVFRSIVQEGDNLYVVTQGYGTGVLPAANEIAARPTWQATDLGIRRELNPYTLLGYPMDEMNAVADIGSQPNGSPARRMASNGAISAFAASTGPMDSNLSSGPQAVLLGLVSN